MPIAPSRHLTHDPARRRDGSSWPPDRRDGLDQRILVSLARIAALAPHDHQPAAFEQFADQPDKETDQCAEDYDRDRAPEGLRKGARHRLIAESTDRAPEHPADRPIAPARR